MILLPGEVPGMLDRSLKKPELAHNEEPTREKMHPLDIEIHKIWRERVVKERISELLAAMRRMRFLAALRMTTYFLKLSACSGALRAFDPGILPEQNTWRGIEWRSP